MQSWRLFATARALLFSFGLGLFYAATLTLLAPLLQASLPTANLGSVAVGSSGSASISIALSSAHSTAPVASLHYGTDFTVGSCQANTTTCTLTITFAPAKAGLRQDGVVVKDSAGNVLAEAMVFGKGLAPQVTFNPAVTHKLYTDPAPLTTSASVATDPNGNVYWSSATDYTIRRLAAGASIPTIIAGQPGVNRQSGDGGPATSATLAVAASLIIDGAGNLYFTDTAPYSGIEITLVRRIDAATGIISTIAGTADIDSFSPILMDGSLATSGFFDLPQVLAVDLRGDIYLSATDIYNKVIRKVDANTDVITTIAGSDVLEHSGDGGLALAAGFNQVQALGFDSAQNLFVLEGNWLRKIDAATQIISTIAGNGNAGNSGLGGPAVNASIGATSLVIDSFDNLYLNANGSSELDRISQATGLITYFAGGQSSLAPADGLLSNGITFKDRFDKIAFDADGNYYSFIQSKGLFEFNAVSPGYGFPSAGVEPLYPSPAAINVFNSGNQNLVLTSESITGSFAAGPPPASAACNFPGTLPSQSNCALTISVIPNSGNVNGALTLTDNALNTPSSTQQAGLSFVYPQPVASPSPLDFGPVSVGSFGDSYQTLTLSNLTTAPFVLDHVSIQGVNAADFTLEGFCSQLDSSNPICNVIILFKPSVVGVRSATMYFYGNIPAPLTVSLTGAGVLPSLALSVSSMNFHQTQWGTSDAQFLTVTNTSPLTIPLDFPNDFQPGAFAVNNSCTVGLPYHVPINLPPGHQCTIKVSFQPQGQIGNFSGAYIIESFQLGVFYEVDFSASSVVEGPELAVGELPLVFSTARNSASAIVPLALKNNGHLAAAITSIALSGSQPADFRQFHNCPALLNPAQSCTIWVSYAPGAFSPANSTAAVRVNAGGSLALTEALSGSIVDSAATRSVIDYPPSGAAVSGTITVSGWAGQDGSTIQSGQIAVDGVVASSTSRGLVRADVCAVYPLIGDCPNPGWSATLDTTQFSDGDHILTLAAASSTATGFATKKIRIANGAASATAQFAIDFPSASQALSGKMQFSGWAVDNSQLAPTDIIIYVDGVKLPAVQRNFRSDVCASLDILITQCPDAGWYLPFDTQNINNGNHSVTFLVVDQHSPSPTYSVQSLQINVENSSNQIAMNIEAPVEGQTVAVNMDIAGWALSSAVVDPYLAKTVSFNAIVADGSSIVQGNILWGMERNDVCQAYPNIVTCYKPGFIGNLDTRGLSNGAHTLLVTFHAEDGTNYTFSRHINVANVLDPSSNQLLVNVDAPASNAILSGTAGISGWVVDGLTYNPSVDLTIDNVPVGSAFPGYNRQDVCAAFPFGKSCPNVGWIGAIDTTLLVDGPHTLGVTATSSTGKRTKKTVPFVANNSAAHLTNGQLLNIEVPAANQNVSGAISIAGWAVSAASPVDEANILIDGVPMGSAQYGLPRADVCTAYPNSQSCPSVGWGFVLDTRTLTNGPHTIEAIESTSNGDAAVTQKFMVSNAGIATSINAVIDSPAPNATISGNYLIAGWAIDDHDLIATVALNVDGLPQGFAAYGGARADVCAVFPGGQNCPNAGWNSYLDTTRFDNGAHTLSVVVTSTHGDVATFTRTLNVGN